jgi:hypothetical protein
MTNNRIKEAEEAKVKIINKLRAQANMQFLSKKHLDWDYSDKQNKEFFIKGGEFVAHHFAEAYLAACEKLDKERDAEMVRFAEWILDRYNDTVSANELLNQFKTHNNE